MANFDSRINFMTSEEPLSSCLLIHVVPPLAVPSPSLKVCQCKKRDMWNSREQNFTIVSAPIPSTSTGPTFYLWE